MRLFTKKNFAYTFLIAGVLFSTACSKENDELTVTPTKLTFVAENPTENYVTIETNVSKWEFSDPGHSWLQVYKQPDKEKDKLYFKIQDNESTTQTNFATITITAGKATPVDILIEQEKKPIKTLTVNPNSLIFGANELGEQTFAITTDAASWEYTEPEALWLQFTKQAQSLVVKTTGVNTQTSERKVEITFTAGNAAPFTGTVIQEAKNTLSVSPTSLTFSPSETAAKDITITTSSSAWDGTTIATWLTLTKNDNILSVTASRNTTTSTRNATITFMAGTADQKTVSVSQTADNLSINRTSLEFEYNSTASQSISVTTNVSDWEAKVDASVTWLTITPNNNSLTVVPNSTNTSTTADLTADVVFTAGYAPPCTLRVTQKRQVPITVSVSQASFNLSYNSSSNQTTTVTTNAASWSASTTTSWLSIVSTTGNTLTFRATSTNTNSTARTGTITVTAPGATNNATVTVTQQPTPPPDPYPRTSMYVANGTPITNNAPFNYTTWNGYATPNTSTSTPSYYSISSWMGSTTTIRIDYLGGYFKLDRTTKLYNDNSGVYGAYQMWGTYNSSTGTVTWYLDMDRNISYNPSTRVFDFSGTYNELPVVVGVIPKNNSTGLWLENAFFLNIYMNLKLTLTPVSSTSSQEMPVLKSNINTKGAELIKIPDGIKVIIVE